MMALFTPEDTAVLLIDHQIGTMSWVGSADQDEVKANALALAKAAVALDMPLILTTSMEDHAQGPMLPEFAENGSMAKAADEIALHRMDKAGADIASTNMILTQLARSWDSPTGQKLIPIVGALIPA